MEIIKSPKSAKIDFKDRGRPNKYPFNNLLPGLSLVIKNCTIDDIKRISSALYQYKKTNSLDWKTSVRFSNNIINVNRIS